MLKNKIGNDMMNVGMDVPFHKEIESNHKVAVAKHIHSEKCKAMRAKRNRQFNKVRILYWNLMMLLTGIVVVSVGRILYDIVRIIKM